jgi:hypothetical protein
MRQTVALIVGTYYSGSSLLNLLLDSQPGIRGLGEAVNLVVGKGEAPCSRCAKPIRECPVHSHVERHRFYGSLFDYYGDCEVLVDSSKSVQTFLNAHPLEQELNYRILLLSKSPQEFVWSCIHHQDWQTIESAFRFYLDFYAKQVELLIGQSWFRPWHCLQLTYRQLTTQTEATLQKVVDFLRGDSRLAETTWQTDTHIVGGNWMVAAQLRSREGPFDGSTWYLQGKYVGKYHTIFYDEQWQTDPEFVVTCLELYERWQPEIEQMLHNLGQPDFGQQVNDLERALAITSHPSGGSTLDQLVGEPGGS